jgi:hypothetical protein
MTTFAEDRQNYRKTLGFFWNKVFLDQDFVEGNVRSFLIKFRDLDDYTEELPDYLSRYLIPLKRTSDIRLFAFDEEERDTYAARYGQGYEYGEDLGYGDVQPAPVTVRYPIESGFSAKFLSVTLEGDQILELGRDYEIEDDVIIFKQDPCELPGAVKLAQTQSDGSIKFVTFLWGFEVEEDVNALCEFYGILAGVCGETSQILKDAVNLAWDFRVDGASVLNIVRAMSLITDTNYAKEDGIVVDIFTEGNRTIIETDNTLYSAPSEYAPVVDIGQSLALGDILFDAFTVRSSTDELPPAEFEAIVLGAGDIAGVEHGILLPNSYEEVISQLPPGYQSIRVEDGSYLVVDKEGTIIGTVDTEEEVATLILGNPTQYLTFFVGGLSTDVDKFMMKLNSGSPSFFQILEDEQGHLPVTINPLQEFRRLFFRDNATFIKVTGTVEDQKLTAQLLSVIYGTYSAGSKIFIVLEKKTSEDAYSLALASEEVTVFYAPTAGPEDSFSEVRDRVIAESVV